MRSWPVIISKFFEVMRPICFAIAEAVKPLSPVTMYVFIPASFVRAMASGTSLRGGSIMPMNPTNVRLFSVAASVYLSFCFLGISLYAIAITRSDFLANSSFFFMSFLRASFVRSTFLPLSKMPVHLSRTSCGAPFVRANIS